MEIGGGGATGIHNLFLRRGEGAFYTLDRARELGLAICTVYWNSFAGIGAGFWLGMLCIAVCFKAWGWVACSKSFWGVRRANEEYDTFSWEPCLCFKG